MSGSEKERNFTTKFQDGDVIFTNNDMTVFRASPDSVILLCPNCGSVETDATEPVCDECGSDLVLEGAYPPTELSQ